MMVKDDFLTACSLSSSLLLLHTEILTRRLYSQPALYGTTV
jgi:hypothetical protein